MCYSRTALVVLLSAFLMACSAKPILIPHDPWRKTSPGQERAAVATCESRVQMMANHVRTRRSLRRSQRQVYSGGRAIGSGLLGQANIGAIGQASAGLLSNYFGWLFSPRGGSINHRAEMERCLMDAGYSVRGWN